MNPVRDRHESQIKRLDDAFGAALEDAIGNLAFRNGLSWFTDNQIAEIRDEMIITEWKRNRRLMASRASYRAALESSQKETA